MESPPPGELDTMFKVGEGQNEEESGFGRMGTSVPLSPPLSFLAVFSFL